MEKHWKGGYLANVETQYAGDTAPAIYINMRRIDVRLTDEQFFDLAKEAFDILERIESQLDLMEKRLQGS